MEPCSSTERCEEGFNCKPVHHVCVVPCSRPDENEELAAKISESNRKKDELNQAQANLEGVIQYFAAKLRGDLTAFIAADIQAYEQPTTFCINDLNLDTSSAISELCNEDDTGDEACQGTPENIEGEICNEDATTGEVMIHDSMIQIQRLEQEIAALDEEARQIISEMEETARERWGFRWSGAGASFSPEKDCQASYEENRKVLDDIDDAVAAVGEFVDKHKCIIIRYTLKLLAKVIDKLAAKLPYIGPALEAMQNQPQCLSMVKWSEFSLRVPGGIVTGAMFFAAIESLLCFIGDIDESVSFFHDVCEEVVVVGNLVNALLSSLCGKFAAAFLSLVEPFIICNAWDCHEEYNVSGLGCEIDLIMIDA